MDVVNLNVAGTGKLNRKGRTVYACSTSVNLKCLFIPLSVHACTVGFRWNCLICWHKTVGRSFPRPRFGATSTPAACLDWLHSKKGHTPGVLGPLYQALGNRALIGSGHHPLSLYPECSLLPAMPFCLFVRFRLFRRPENYC